MLTGLIPAHFRTRRSRDQRIIAGVLLVLVVVFLVLNPLWECHDHMDNLRHLGPHGMLMIFLLFACAGITLFQSCCLFRAAGLRTSLLEPQRSAAFILHTRDTLLLIFSADLLVPLRI